jgi:hypothetical protein
MDEDLTFKRRFGMSGIGILGRVKEGPPPPAFIVTEGKNCLRADCSATPPTHYTNAIFDKTTLGTNSQF